MADGPTREEFDLESLYREAIAFDRRTTYLFAGVASLFLVLTALSFTTRCCGLPRSPDWNTVFPLVSTLVFLVASELAWVYPPSRGVPVQLRMDSSSLTLIDARGYQKPVFWDAPGLFFNLVGARAVWRMPRFQWFELRIPWAPKRTYLSEVAWIDVSRRLTEAGWVAISKPYGSKGAGLLTSFTRRGRQVQEELWDSVQ